MPLFAVHIYLLHCTRTQKDLTHATETQKHTLTH